MNKPAKADSYAGYSIAAGYRSATIYFYSSATKKRIGTLKMSVPESVKRQERYAAIADFLKNNPQIAYAPNYHPTKAEIKHEHAHAIHEQV